MTTPEERLAAALADRAAAARTSPDALDGVFHRVASHRRRTRAAAGAAIALALVASAAVATNALRPDAATLEPVAPAPTAPPTSPPPATATPTRPAHPAVAGYPDDSAVVVGADRRVLVVSTTTGAQRAQLGRLPADATGSGLAWSPDRSLVYFERGGCRVAAMDRTGAVRDVTTGTAPAVSPDGRRLATAACPAPYVQGAPAGGVIVTDLRSRRVTPIRGLPQDPRPDYTPPPSATSVTWFDAHTLAVAVAWEDPEDVVVVDVDRDRDLGHGERLHVAVGDLVARGDTRLAVTTCCMPDWTERARILRLPWRGTRTATLLTFHEEAGSVELDRAGQVLFRAREGLWRWRPGSAPVLVRRGVTAVAG
ncbi:MAG TPA: hypothetical protein VFQ85_11490 [Mycobacteriales bacterium]|jgi:hypothetical protein|nr:hypothetical protein [Mycobacteriales bacterium]